MPGEEVYEFYIDSFTPETIPMARLAGYMASFAELLGSCEHVHFGKLKPGSLSVAARVDEIAQRKVDKRVDEVRYGGGPQSAQKARRDIHDKLAEDNAVGRIIHGRAKLIEFPGRTRHAAEKLGPVEQSGTLDGEVIQIGGRDETINIHLKAGGSTCRRVLLRRQSRGVWLITCSAAPSGCVVRALGHAWSRGRGC